MLADVLLSFGEQVAVTVKGGLDRGMAELGLDELGVGSLGNEERRVGVSEVVEPNLSEAGPG